MTNEWTKPEHAKAYLARMKDIPHRGEGEATLLAEIPTEARRVLDLGCGNGHLLSRVLSHCPDATGVGIDFSPTMLEQARGRFAENERVRLIQHNLDNPLPDLGAFDCIVSSFAIHHCNHQRKEQIYAEVFCQLQVGGVFCNLEHVSSPSESIHDRFVEAMGMTPDDEDPSNQLLDVGSQLRWLREIGFEEVDCHWKWRELALLSGRKPQAAAGSASVETHSVKQVIVMRHDLNMRRGKQIAQGAHASMSFLCRRLQETGSIALEDFSDAERAWLSGTFAKVCCRVESEDELIDIHAKAVAAGLEVHLITDSGKTEFHGQPTRTCLAIGPDEAETIDEITGELRLL